MVAPVVAAAGIGALADLGGGLVDQYFAGKAADKSYKFQKKVLQNSVQWRVDDAIRAGIHPLAALGMNPASGPSVSVGSSGLGGAIANMGGNISRAAEALLTPTDKLAAQSALLDIEQKQANIDLTRAQLAGAQKALLTQGSTPGIASNLPVLPPGALYGSRDRDPQMNQRLQDRHGEVADLLTAPQSILEVVSQPGNIADPRMVSKAYQTLWDVWQGSSSGVGGYKARYLNRR